MNNIEKHLEELPFEVTEEEKYNSFLTKLEEHDGKQTEITVIPIELEKTRTLTRKESKAETSMGLYHDILDELSKKENGATTRQDESSSEDFQIDENLKVIIDESKYRIISIRTSKERGEYYELASNFILSPLYRILEEDGNEKHYVKLDNGYETKRVIIDGETLSINRNFKSFCRQKGDYNWKGSQEDLNQLNDFMIQQRCDVVEQVKYIGYLYDIDYLSEEIDEDGDDETNESTPKKLYNTMSEDIWIFPTHAYYNGELFLPDEDNIYRFPTRNILLDFDKSDNIVKKHIRRKPTSEDVINVLANTQELYHYYTWLGIGFMTASLQTSTISQVSRQFPFFYPVGIRNTGKTEYTTFMYKFAGVNALLESPPQRIDQFRKQLRWYSNLPFGYDEAQQQSEEKKDKDFFLRFAEELKTIFNRKGLKRGDKDPDKLLKFPARAALTFGGEVATGETAIKSRSIFIDALKFKIDEDTFDELLEQDSIMYWLGQYMMRTAHEWREEFVTTYKSLIVEMKGISQYKKITSRVRKNYAIILAGAITFQKRISKEFNITMFNEAYLLDLKHFIYKEMVISQRDVEDQHQCITFLSEIASLAKNGHLEKNTDYKIQNELLYLSQNESWNAHKKQKFKTSYASTNAVTNDLRAYPFYKDNSQKKINGKNYRCWVFDLKHELIPEFFQHFIEPNIQSYDNPH